MKKTLLFRVFVLTILLLDNDLFYGQTILDHNSFIGQLRSSNTTFYKDCIRKYNSYLDKHPEDISVLIEKCKFIESAQYDEENEYNPNQEEFDSCLAILTELYPAHPDVLVYQTSLLWGDELKEIFKVSWESIRKSPEQWSKNDLGTLYSREASQFYDENEIDSAYVYIQKAISNDDQYQTSLEYARILSKMGKKDEALKAILENQDSTKDVWNLQQKADFLLELKAYSAALNVYTTIEKIDSTYNNNLEISSSLSAIGEYDLARKYLVADTSKKWDKEVTLKNLFIHDLDHQDGLVCIKTYNQFRDLGYSIDPLGVYRLKLFISHPLQPWKLRDILGLFTLLVLLIILILLPSIWILPIYFIGTHWNLINSKKTFDSHWGLKMFWIICAAYLMASLIAYFTEPDYLYSLFNKSSYGLTLSQDKEARIFLVFILLIGSTGLYSLRNIDLRILLSKNWSVIRSILIGVGILIVFIVVEGIYMKLGVTILGISKNDLITVADPVLSSKHDVEAIIATYGNGMGLVLFCLFVPLYEEVIFRGVVLESTTRYLNFGAANAFQAFLFSLIHLNLFLIPVYFLFGVIAGNMRKKSGGLLPGLVFHSFNNFFAILFLILH